MKTDYKSSAMMEQITYLGTTLTDQNSIQEEIKSRLKLGNVCYHSVQDLLPSNLPSKNTKIDIYRATVLPVALYGCETWLLMMREEHTLWLFENRVLRKIFGRRRDGVTGEWRRLHNKELNDVYCSPNIIQVIKSRRMRRVGHVAHMGERRDAYRVLVGKHEGKRSLGRSRHRWDDNIKMDLQELW
jgi:hypothetical protein